MNSKARYVLIVAVLLYLASLTQLGFVAQESNVWPGWGILLFGFLGLCSGHMTNLIWLANPLLFCTWAVFIAHSKFIALFFAVLSLIVAASFLFCKTVEVSEAGGSGYEITHIGLGYWLWLASISLTVIACIMSILRSELS